MRRKTHPAARALAGLLILGSLGTVFLEWIGIRFLGMQFSFYDAFANAMDNSFGSDTEETLVVAMGAVLALTGLIGLVCAFPAPKGAFSPILWQARCIWDLPFTWWKGPTGRPMASESPLSAWAPGSARRWLPRRCCACSFPKVPLRRIFPTESRKETDRALRETAFVPTAVRRCVAEAPSAPTAEAG